MLTRRNFLAIAAGTAAVFSSRLLRREGRGARGGRRACGQRARGVLLGHGQHGGRRHRDRRAPGRGRLCHRGSRALRGCGPQLQRRRLPHERRARGRDQPPSSRRSRPMVGPGYDTVLLGYPIWWGEAAWPLRTFAEGNDFGEKTRGAVLHVGLLGHRGQRRFSRHPSPAPATGSQVSASRPAPVTRRPTGLLAWGCNIVLKRGAEHAVHKARPFWNHHPAAVSGRHELRRAFG